MSAAYALAVRNSQSRTPMYGTRAELALAGGEVEGCLALAGCDRRSATASYALRVDNQSEHPLRARMTCLLARGSTVLAYPLDVAIAPYSRCETLLPVRLDEIGHYDRAIVEVRGGNVAFTLEAPAPTRRYRRFPWFGAAISVLTLVVATALCAGLAAPHIVMLAAPMRVFAGSSIDVPYAFGGWGTLEYALRTLDGRQLRAGLAVAHQGTLRFNVPAAAGREVALSVAVQGPFGLQSRVQRILITPPSPAIARPPTVQPPRITSFALLSPVVHAGGTLSLGYVTNAQRGDIWLIDESGRLWARAPITPDGHTTIALPQGTAGLPMRAVLHARAGASDAVASLALTVLPSALVQDTPAPAAATADAVPPAQATLTLSSSQAAPGDTITVSVDGTHGDTAISLSDAAGTTLEQGDIPSTQNAMTLTAPRVDSAKTFYVTAAISQGTSSQTLVRKLRVAPR